MRDGVRASEIAPERFCGSTAPQRGGEETDNSQNLPAHRSRRQTNGSQQRRRNRQRKPRHRSMTIYDVITRYLLRMRTPDCLAWKSEKLPERRVSEGTAFSLRRVSNLEGDSGKIIGAREGEERERDGLGLRVFDQLARVPAAGARGDGGTPLRENRPGHQGKPPATRARGEERAGRQPRDRKRRRSWYSN